MVRMHSPAARGRTRWVWVLVVCLVYAAFVPGASHALGPTQWGPAQYICVSVGSPNSQDPSPPEDGSAMHVPHCPFCLQSTDRGAPPPQPLPYHFLVHGGSTAPMVWQALFFPEFVSSLPQVRGPPALTPL